MPTPAEMAAVFERIRDAVIQEATRPSPYDSEQHATNKAKFAKQLSGLCHGARLRPDMTAGELWFHVWTKIRYAGFRASYVTLEIERLKPFFEDFKTLAGPEWRFDPAGKQHGVEVREFLGKSGRFKDIGYSRLKPKLCKILKSAEEFRAFPSGTPALVALFGEGYDEPTDEALWRAHKRLKRLVGFTTALHVMTDIGFNCVKPDIWLVRMMSRLGWIEGVLPSDTPDKVIAQRYQKPAIAPAVISRARQISTAIHALYPDAPLREFDFVMVKYGQRPGEYGIVRSLYELLPVQRIMEWQSGSGGFPTGRC